jgi:hypothetical protein
VLFSLVSGGSAWAEPPRRESAASRAPVTSALSAEAMIVDAPESAALVLTGAGLLGLASAARRRHQRAE